MLLVPAGHLVDAVIKDLVPLLDMQDLIIGSGNSRFVDVWASLSQC
jgi:6-phosphogluconate dehydrogenase